MPGNKEAINSNTRIRRLKPKQSKSHHQNFSNCF